MEAPWLSSVLNILEDVPHQCPIVKDLAMDILVCQVFKGLPCLYLNLCCSEMCVTQARVLFLSLFGSGRGDVSIYDGGLPVVLERIGGLVFLKGSTKQCHMPSY